MITPLFYWITHSMTTRMLHLQAEILKADHAADEGLLIAMAYQWIKAESDATLSRLRAESLERFYQLIADLPPAPQLR